MKQLLVFLLTLLLLTGCAAEAPAEVPAPEEPKSETAEIPAEETPAEETPIASTLGILEAAVFIASSMPW